MEATSCTTEAIKRLEAEIRALRARCSGLEQQQAQLAALLGLTMPATARLALTRFPLSHLGATLPDQLPVRPACIRVGGPVCLTPGQGRAPGR